MQLAAACLVSFSKITIPDNDTFCSSLTNPSLRSSTFSHISSGYLYHSPTYSKVRADASYDSSIVSSLFDYTNTNRNNLVWNTLFTIEPSVCAAPKIWTGFVKPAWALFKEDILVKSNAVFAGVVDDRWLGATASVSPDFRLLLDLNDDGTDSVAVEDLV
jgi:hypothetical protein